MSNLDKRKTEVLNSFFIKFGTVAPPQCFWCLKSVEEFGIDYFGPRDEIVATAKCHGDQIEFRLNVHEIMKHNKIIMRSAFQPGEGSRTNGKLQTSISQKGKSNQEVAANLKNEIDNELDQGVKSAY